MTVIFDTVDFWIEYFFVPRANLANNASVITTHTLKKAGHYVGAAASVDSNAVGGIIANLNVAIQLAATGAEVPYGASISSIGTRHSNASGIASEVGVQLLVFMRK